MRTNHFAAGKRLVELVFARANRGVTIGVRLKHPSMRVFVAASFVLLVGAGCAGSQTTRQRAAVNDYIAAANRIEMRAEPSVRSVAVVFRRMSVSRLTRTERQRLNAAVRALFAAEASLRRLQPPLVAAQLHRTLLRLYRLECRLAQEVRTFALFLPAAELALAGARAHPAEDNRKVTGAQLAAYARGLRGAASKLTALQAPAALKPWARDEAEHLRGLARELDRLGAALHVGDAAAAKVFALRYRRLVANGIRVSAAQRQALVAYNARVRALDRLRNQLAGEQVELERTFG